LGQVIIVNSDANIYCIIIILFIYEN